MSKSLGQFLEQLRGKMTLREAAAKSGLSHTYIRDIELGVNRKTKAPIKPSPETLKSLAKAYDYPFIDLMKKAGHLQSEDKKVWALSTELNEKENTTDASVFFHEWEKLSDEDKEKALAHIKFLQHMAKQENKKK